ncbi:MAG: sigma-70 family RNA polymerase sigma factor [Defluviitaleaceae bacterium]|nr:sigma-70 family RNA polymerase sigma factor [Defluviitaleaceae bacterium]
MKTIEFNDEMVTKYAKKIFGFAYSKTRNTHQAQELAHDILCSLVDSLRKQSSIADLDGYIYTVSNYTWYKFLRKNKRHWNNLDVDTLYNLQSQQNVETEAENALLIEKLTTEIAYLTELHRKITIMFYYDNKTSSKIAKLLDISHSTIRWHLTEIKKKLKEGIEMRTTVYEPKRLWCGHDGYAQDEKMCGLGHNPLVDNIALVCYGKELTIEEISRTLQVAAFYIEPLIKDLTHLDYLRVVKKNKYSTNFFIRTENFSMAEAKYKFHNIKPCAEKIIKMFRTYQNELKQIGFVGSDLDTDFLLWAFIPMALQVLYSQSLVHVLKQNKTTVDTPTRKDGSQHWVCAGLRNDAYDINRFTAEEVDFKEKSNGNGIKSNNREDGDTTLCSLQYESYATIKMGIYWREFDDIAILHGIKRIASIIRNNETPNDYDKEVIASFAKHGYAKIENGMPKLLIPFLFADEWQKYDNLWQKIHRDIGQNIFVSFIEGFAAEMQKEIPAFISEAERNYIKYEAYPQYAVLYWLADNGLLRYPSDEEAKRLCTIVMCK